MKKFIIYMSIFLSLFWIVGHRPDGPVRNESSKTSGRASIATTNFTPPTNLIYSVPTNPCDEYNDLEAGHGSFDRQGWFNHLTIPEYTRFRMACVYHWDGAQFNCLDKLWTAESRWGDAAPYNIPQLKPDPRQFEYRSNQRVQARAGLEYIDRRTDYKNPCDAWSLWQQRRPHWY